MRMVFLFLGLALIHTTSAQQPTSPGASAAPRAPSPPAQAAPTIPAPVIPPDNQQLDIPGNPRGQATPSRPVQGASPIQSNMVGSASQPLANPTPTAESTNQPPAATNAMPRMNFSITNTLSAMAPAQARNVIQLRSGLNSLQNVFINVGGVQNIQQLVQQNPQIQQQLQQTTTQISALAHGPVKPSSDSVDRLSWDLLRSYAHARMTPDVQLVIAIYINQACNSGNLTPVQIQETLANTQATLQGIGVPISVAQPVACDLQSIAYELQAGNLR